MRKVTWDDLTIDLTNIDVREVYEDWNWLVNEKIMPLMMTKFGDLFFIKENGKVYFLDTIEGEVKSICNSKEEFVAFINQKENIENYLLSYIIVDLINNNHIPSSKECYSFETPPILGGKIEADNVTIMSILVSISITGQIHRQVKDLPEGAAISGFKICE